MHEMKRRSVLAVLGGAFVTAGCVSDPTDIGGSSAGETTTTPDDTTATDDGTTTDDWISAASKTPTSDHAISLRNESDEARTVRLRVVREKTGETVYEETHDLSAGGGVYVYNLKRADPDGVEAFSVYGELVGSATTGTHTADSRGESDEQVLWRCRRDGSRRRSGHLRHLLNPPVPSLTIESPSSTESRQQPSTPATTVTLRTVPFPRWRTTTTLATTAATLAFAR